MDTFWESVRKEERATRRKRLLIIGGVAIVTLAVVVSPIAAKHQEPAAVCETQEPVAVCETQEPVAVCETQEPVAVCETQDPGTLPDSPFYFVKDWERSIRLSFAFDTREKATLSLGFADEDALAINALYDKEEYILGGKQCG